jgi:hypothetical protein
LSVKNIAEKAVLNLTASDANYAQVPLKNKLGSSEPVS